MKMLPFAFALFPVVVSAACLPLSGDRILGRDLAAADVVFSALPATLQIGYAPMAGSTRVFSIAELERIARANRVASGDLHELCFEFSMHAGMEPDLVEAMRTSLNRDASIRIVEMSKTPIPSGKIEFPLTGLEPPATGGDGVQMWRGFVQYTETRRVPLWARVAVTVPYSVVVATCDLGAGSPVDPACLRVETRNGSLKREPIAARLDEVIGHVLQRPLKAGAEIALALLTSLPVVHRGDSVKVEVQSGSAVLRFDAIAESSARAGEIADVRNPINGKILRVRVDSDGTAVIVVGKTPAL